ncbi:DUF1852 domain-containing protein [Novosphingobium sp. P6W]|uniref:DUF1852 domain-containing protein n=1 Tax=Novosphingobium sp. P6W TaxID=1609758 RepID=UPI0005C2E27C|nr:DUF1852 domain-containing protein [Novosphingobium sp. P6W]AXB80568.1 DUF1852 domain-containing protein [Novosphingobium sp. P6W]KIS31674.1 hypothetical protein TQ38_15605 [Novosphingobium sp. P6W]
MTDDDLTFSITRIRFDEEYRPSDTTRITTNFANLARGANRQENLRGALTMIDNRFNDLADWDNPDGDRYSVELDIISVEMSLANANGGAAFPMIEILNTSTIDRKTDRRIAGIVGNNFSSYMRDYDFSVLLAEHNRDRAGFSTPVGFGDLHGRLFRHFVQSAAYKANFAKPPVICLSVSSSKTYHRTENHHPILGIEYRQNEFSPTDEYFAKMGLQVRYFMPRGSNAPMAFYFAGDLLGDYSNLELIGTISTMESFQKIYRPEIYNANHSAGAHFRPSLTHGDFSPTRIVYDREERSRLGIEQGRFAEENFIKPYQHVLAAWSAKHAF